MKTRAEGAKRGAVTRPAAFTDKAVRRSVTFEPSSLRWLQAQVKAGGTGTTISTVIGGLVDTARRARR